MEHKIWDDTFSSQLCCGIWVPRQHMADRDQLRAALDLEWTKAREDFVQRALEWQETTREIEAFII